VKPLPRSGYDYELDHYAENAEWQPLQEARGIAYSVWFGLLTWAGIGLVVIGIYLMVKQ
jgi:hypothetical protein